MISVNAYGFAGPMSHSIVSMDGKLGQGIVTAMSIFQ